MPAYPHTDLVILAGGQARRMGGVNKLLQTFDQQDQLSKIVTTFASQVAQIWVNSHRDHARYLQQFAQLRCYADDEAGFFGPLMGMKSAWSHVAADYVLFVPCDITVIAPNILAQLHQALAQHPSAEVAYVVINAQALYPFCLMKRSAFARLDASLAQQQRRLKHCFDTLHAVTVEIENPQLQFHSLNSVEELEKYR